MNTDEWLRIKGWSASACLLWRSYSFTSEACNYCPQNGWTAFHFCSETTYIFASLDVAVFVLAVLDVILPYKLLLIAWCWQDSKRNVQHLMASFHSFVILCFDFHIIHLLVSVSHFVCFISLHCILFGSKISYSSKMCTISAVISYLSAYFCKCWFFEICRYQI